LNGRAGDAARETTTIVFLRFNIPIMKSVNVSAQRVSNQRLTQPTFKKPSDAVN
jgi:hypothetical protein